jgi:drug/metabolite transporter (DMT)-like permease
MSGNLAVRRAKSGPSRGRIEPRLLSRAVIPAAFVLAWSSAYIVGAVGVRSTPPFTLTFARFALAAVLMAGVSMLVRARWPRSRREWFHTAAAGFLVQGVQFVGVYAGLKLGVPAAISALVIGINPVLTALVARPVLNERISLRQQLGFLLGVIGVVLAVVQGLHLSGSMVAGTTLTVVGLVGISCGTVYQKKFCGDMDLRSGQAIQLAAAALLAGVCAVAFEHVHTDNYAMFAFATGWLALINSIGAVTLLYVMVRRGQAGRASTAFFLVPSVTAVMAAVILREPLTVLAVIGFAVAAVGVLFATHRTSTSRDSDHPG